MSETVKEAEKQRRKAEAGKYLTFMLGEEEYGIEILKVQEIIGLIDITKVPRVPEYIKGVINLRGKVIPVIDLRVKFELDAKEYTERTCIIVVQVGHKGQTITMGCIVDEVREVMDFADHQIEPPPDFGVQVDTRSILGIGKDTERREKKEKEDRVAILIDVDRVLAESEVEEIKKM